MPLDISPTQQEVAFDYSRCPEHHVHISCNAVMWKQADGSYKSTEDMSKELALLNRPCEQKGTKNAMGAIKDFTCLELPAKLILKPVEEWMCRVCAYKLFRRKRI